MKKEALVFRHTSQGTTIQGITKNALRTFQIPVPPLEEQERIVEELEGYEKVIEGARAVIDRFEKKIQAAISRVWGE